MISFLELKDKKIAIIRTNARAGGEVTRVDLRSICCADVLGGKVNCFGRYIYLKNIFCHYLP